MGYALIIANRQIFIYGNGDSKMKIKYTYQIVKENREARGHIMYFLRSNNVKALSEMWVGENKLRRMYKDGLIVGKMTDQQRYVATHDKSERQMIRRERKDREEKEEQQPAMYKLPDVFEVER